MKIYTKTGDSGETGLFAGPRVRKDHDRIEAYGAVDELNALLGVVRTCELPSEVDERLAEVQHELFALGAELATPDPAAAGTALLTDRHIARLEDAIDHFTASLPPLGDFILPGGTTAAAQLHLARTVCRRAERRVVTLTLAGGLETVSLQSLIYLNRLSDLLFVLARFVNAEGRHDEEIWRKPE